MGPLLLPVVRTRAPEQTPGFRFECGLDSSCPPCRSINTGKGSRQKAAPLIWSYRKEQVKKQRVKASLMLCFQNTFAERSSCLWSPVEHAVKVVEILLPFYLTLGWWVLMVSE